MTTNIDAAGPLDRGVREQAVENMVAQVASSQDGVIANAITAAIGESWTLASLAGRLVRRVSRLTNGERQMTEKQQLAAIRRAAKKLIAACDAVASDYACAIDQLEFEEEAAESRALLQAMRRAATMLHAKIEPANLK